MSPILNPHVAIRYEKPSHRELLIEHMGKLTSKKQMLSDWEQLLAGSGGESSIQKFIERHPYLLPGLYDYHNGPCRGVIVSQFPFGADYRADFAFVSVNSMMLQFTFVEIEDPAKPIFNEDFSFSQVFNKALQQVRDWRGWAESNKDTLLNMFADLFVAYDVRNDLKSIQCYLVCGRRESVEINQRARERWSSLKTASSNDIVVMTYDRLTASSRVLPTDQINHTLAVCSYKQRGFFLKPEVLGL